MDEKAKEVWREEARLSREQQAEIGDIFLSARTVSRQMVLQAREQSDEILKTARDRAEQIVTEAEERAERILREAEERASAIVVETRPANNSDMSPEMQDYVIRAVGECFEKLRLRQQENMDFINSQWQGFLSGLSISDALPPAAPQPQQSQPGQEITRQEIQERVSAIAKELMEIIGK